MRLRHVATGRFLAVGSLLNGQGDEGPSVRQTRCASAELVSPDNPDGKCVDFKIELTSTQTSGVLPLKEACFRLQALCQNDGLPWFLHNLNLNLEEEGGSGESLHQTLRIGFTDVKHTEDAFVVQPVSRDQMICILAACAVQPVLQRLEQQTLAYDSVLSPQGGVGESKLDNESTDAGDSDVVDSAIRALEKCRTLCRSGNEEESGAYSINPVVWQMTARMFSLLDLLFSILASRAQTRTLAEKESEPRFALMAKCQAAIYVTIKELVHENRESENYVARMELKIQSGGNVVKKSTAINLLIQHAGAFEEAAGCVSGLLNNNADLLKQFVTDDTIEEFINLIREQGPKPLFMNFFTAICSCQGHQILKNQERCVRKLLVAGPDGGDVDRTGLVFEQGLGNQLIVVTRSASHERVEWPNDVIKGSLPNRGYLGKDAVRGGLPCLEVQTRFVALVYARALMSIHCATRWHGHAMRNGGEVTESYTIHLQNSTFLCARAITKGGQASAVHLFLSDASPGFWTLSSCTSGCSQSFNKRSRGCKKSTMSRRYLAGGRSSTIIWGTTQKLILSVSTHLATTSRHSVPTSSVSNASLLVTTKHRSSYLRSCAWSDLTMLFSHSRSFSRTKCLWALLSTTCSPIHFEQNLGGFYSTCGSTDSLSKNLPCRHSFIRFLNAKRLQRWKKSKANSVTDAH